MKTRSGRILPGYRADMVLLRDDPLEEIRNTTTIEAVVVNGSYLDRAALYGVLSAVREANDQSRSVALDQEGGR